MPNEHASNGSEWLQRFTSVTKTEDQLVHTANTADAFSAASAAVNTGADFEREPSSFFALLHDLAPEELKK